MVVVAEVYGGVAGGAVAGGRTEVVVAAHLHPVVLRAQRAVGRHAVRGPPRGRRVALGRARAAGVVARRHSRVVVLVLLADWLFLLWDKKK